uniref:Uncharacterized protein n=1 Tax=Vitis vinifera TaxID=29760 RepID=F6I7J6_VITVI
MVGLGSMVLLVNLKFGLSRKFHSVQATILQENEEKVTVEESFQSNSFPEDDSKGCSGAPQDSSSSSVLNRWVIKFEQSFNVFLTESVIKILDTLYHDRDYARFFVLETIARVPYFGECLSFFISSTGLALWEGLMISLEKFSSVWPLKSADIFHEMIEQPLLRGTYLQVCTYWRLRAFLFHMLVGGKNTNSLNLLKNLYDVFLNIRDDEAEHCKTMKACQTHGNLRSPHSYPEDAFDDESGSILPQAECEESFIKHDIAFTGSCLWFLVYQWGIDRKIS